MLSDAAITRLEQAGFKRWKKSGYDRLYINASTLGLQCDTYSSGWISTATYNGVLISNARARRMLAMQMYVDVATGEFVARSGRGQSADDEIATAAKTLYEAILADSADVEIPMRTDIEDMTVAEFMQAFRVTYVPGVKIKIDGMRQQDREAVKRYGTAHMHELLEYLTKESKQR